jgi:hypothetical protein
MAYQVLSLFLLAIPIASIAWTITHEEVVSEFRDVCLGKSTTCRRIYERKFFYLFTCEYCFSHYVAAVFLIITRFKLLSRLARVSDRGLFPGVGGECLYEPVCENSP